MNFANLRGRFKPFQRAPRANRHRAVARPGVTMLMLPFMLLALFVGMIGGLDSPRLLAIVGSAVLSVLLLFLLPRYWLFLWLFVLTFIIQGSALYFLKFTSATWLSFGLAILFFCRALLDMVLRHKQTGQEAPRHGGDVLIWLATLFLVIFAISTVFNRISVTQIASSVKSYLPMFSVLFAMYWFRWTEKQLVSIWKLMLVVVYLQLPVVVYQHFFIMSTASFDAIVGTFGGMPGQGGNSAFMVLFTVVTMLYGMARWDHGLMSGRHLLFLLLVGVALVLLGEVKAAFVWLPIGALWVLRRRVMRSIVSLIMFTALAGSFMAVTYFVYDALYWNNKIETMGSVSDKFEAGGGYFFDTNNVNYRTGEISRGASIALWMRDPVGGMPERLVGYGPSASKPSGLMGAGKVALRYAPLNLNSTALAILLWDVGLLGTFAYLAMLVVGFFLAVRMARNGSSDQRAIADTTAGAMLLFLTMPVYSRSIIDEPTAQLLLMLCLGTVVQLCRYGASAKASIGASPAPQRATIVRPLAGQVI